MGDRMMLYYKYVSDVAGMTGKIKLAQLTKMPSTQAALESDTPTSLAKFKSAVEEITGRPAPQY